MVNGIVLAPILHFLPSLGQVRWAVLLNWLDFFAVILHTGLSSCLLHFFLFRVLRKYVWQQITSEPQ